MKHLLSIILITMVVSIFATAAPVGICLHAYSPDAPAEKIECFEFERTEKMHSGTRFFLPNGRTAIITDYRTRGIVLYPQSQLSSPQELAKLLAVYETHCSQSPSTRPHLNPWIQKMRNSVDHDNKLSEDMASLPTINLADGTKLEGCRATKRSESTVTVIHSGGIKTINIAELSDAVKKSLKWDEIPVVALPPPVAQNEDPAQDSPAAPSGETATPATQQHPSLTGVQINDGSSMRKKAEKIEEMSKKAIYELEVEVTNLEKESSASEQKFEAAGGEKQLLEIKKQFGSSFIITIQQALVDPSYRDLAPGGGNIYSFTFCDNDSPGIVVTDDDFRVGGRGEANLRFLKSIKVNLTNGGMDSRDVYVETPGMDLDNPPEIVKLYDIWQSQLAKIKESKESIKRIDSRRQEATELLNTGAELIGSLRLPQLIISPRLTREGFTAAIQDRKFNDMMGALKTGSLVKIEACVEPSSSYRSKESQFELLDNYSPTDDRNLPKMDDLERLFSDLVFQNFRVELTCSNSGNVMENKRRNNNAFQQRYYVYIPHPPGYLKKFIERRSGFEHKMDCRTDMIANDEITANETGYLKEVQVFSCSAIAFSYSGRPANTPEEKIKYRLSNLTVSLSQENLELLQSYKNKIKAAEQAYESGRIEKDAHDKAVAVVAVDYVAQFKKLLLQY